MACEVRVYELYIDGSEHTPTLKEWQSLLREYCDYISLFETDIRCCDYHYELKALCYADSGIWKFTGELAGIISIKAPEETFKFTNAEDLATVINSHSGLTDSFIKYDRTYKEEIER